VHGRGLDAASDLSEVRVFNQKAVIDAVKGGGS
jgi:hypothetical protein